MKIGIPNACYGVIKLRELVQKKNKLINRCRTMGEKKTVWQGAGATTKTSCKRNQQFTDETNVIKWSTIELSQIND